MMAALWSLLNLMLSVFLPFLNVMMNSLFGWLACTRTWSGFTRQTKRALDQKVAEGKDLPAHEPREEW